MENKVLTTIGELKITEKDLERINSMIEQYKKTKSYQENKYRIKD